MKSLFAPSTPPKLPLPNHIELVSIHIPKTGGTSLRNILIDVYGEKGVWRLDNPLVKPANHFRINQKPYSKNRLPKHVKVVHGHFKLPRIQQILDLPENIPVITWLRDPVERVISNYFYLSRRLREILDEEKKGLNILSKMERSLMEYAAAERNQNIMSKFLDGVALSEMTFVGVLENKQEDLTFLQQKMGWSVRQDYWHNATGGHKRQVTEEQKQQIAAWNPEDVALYQQAIELRETRSL